MTGAGDDMASRQLMLDAHAADTALQAMVDVARIAWHAQGWPDLPPALAPLLRRLAADPAPLVAGDMRLAPHSSSFFTIRLALSPAALRLRDAILRRDWTDTVFLEFAGRAATAEAAP